VVRHPPPTKQGSCQTQSSIHLLADAELLEVQLFGRDVSFIAKWLHEFHAKRRLAGDHVFGSIALGF